MEEALVSASRRAVRFFMIDMNKGGLITPETEAAMQTLDRMWRKEAERQGKPADGDA